MSGQVAEDVCLRVRVESARADLGLAAELVANGKNLQESCAVGGDGLLVRATFAKETLEQEDEDLQAEDKEFSLAKATNVNEMTCGELSEGTLVFVGSGLGLVAKRVVDGNQAVEHIELGRRQTGEADWDTHGLGFLLFSFIPEAWLRAR